VRFIVQLNVLEVLFALADERFCMTLLQLSLQTIHDLERFISLCAPTTTCTGFASCSLSCSLSTDSFPQSRFQVGQREQCQSRLRTHREVDQKRLCGAVLAHRVLCFFVSHVFDADTPSFCFHRQTWMNLAIPLFRRQLPLQQRP
jgi:hypothetical protein